MALATLVWSFYAWQRALGTGRDESQRCPRWCWAAIAGALFGIAVNMREPLFTFALWPILSIRLHEGQGRWRLLSIAAGASLLTLGAGVLMGWAWCWRADYGYFRNISGWIRWMAVERNEHPNSYLENTAALAVHMTITAPLAVTALIAAGGRYLSRRIRGVAASSGRSPLRPTVWIIIAAVPQALMLLSNHNLPVTPRHALAFGWMLVPFSASLVAAWIRSVAEDEKRRRRMTLLVTACAIPIALSVNIPTLAYARQHYDPFARMRDAVVALPVRTLVLPGTGTPVARYLVRMDVRPDLLIIESGWTFPQRGEELEHRIDTALSEGRPVYVNTDRAAWMWGTTPSREWGVLEAALESYELEPGNEATRPLARIRGRGGP